MPHPLPPLPYPMDALQPHISAETLEYHYGKHHAAYVNNLNAQINGTGLEGFRLEALINKSSGSIFNNAAQAWNHAFYWNSLSPSGGDQPSGPLAVSLEKRWGTFAAFKEAFTKSAVGNLGSGWTWLVKKSDGSLEVINTSNAGTPLTGNDKPLLVCDVWEHAYYIDYRDRRPDYLAAFWNLANWEFAARNLS